MRGLLIESNNINIQVPLLSKIFFFISSQMGSNYFDATFFRPVCGEYFRGFESGPFDIVSGDLYTNLPFQSSFPLIQVYKFN